MRSAQNMDSEILWRIRALQTNTSRLAKPPEIPLVLFLARYAIYVPSVLFNSMSNFWCVYRMAMDAASRFGLFCLPLWLLARTCALHLHVSWYWALSLVYI